jgi:hypothetical protein
MHPDRKRRWLIAAVLLVTLSIAAVAGYAYWTAGGSGSGTAATGTTSPLTVKQTTTVSALYPGGPAQALSGNFDNPNEFGVHVSQVSGSISAVSPVGCAASNFQLSGSPVTVDATVPSGNNEGSWAGMSIRLLDTGANQDVCKNATVTIAYTAT